MADKVIYLLANSEVRSYDKEVSKYKLAGVEKQL